MSRAPWFVSSALLVALAAVAVGAVALVARAADPPAAGLATSATPEATWQAPKGSLVRRQLQEWLASRNQAEPTAAAARDRLGHGRRLDRRRNARAAGRRFGRRRSGRQGIGHPLLAPAAWAQYADFPWLADNATPAIERNNLRLLYGRWLVQANLYDEALVQLQSLRPEDVVDPAGLLFYQSVVYHRLLKKEAGLEALSLLLEPGHEIPRRYLSVARLMQSDLAPLKDDSLDHIARRMEDIRRRLDLGRAGQQVRDVEDGVIKSLDKLIKELEDQAAAAAAAAAQGGNNVVPVTPAQDSLPIGGKGPGNIVQRDIGHQSGWGDLPPRQRQEALQQIGKDFPAHYRDVIEQYFRKLAAEDSQAP